MQKKLYILPFDHRASFVKMFGFSEENLTLEQTALLADYKHIIYEGFLAALEMGVPKEAAAILVDEQFGAKIQEEASVLGVKRILAVEKSGQEEFDFEYGQNFGAHIEKFKPDYVKTLLRYNPDGDRELNNRQIAKLKIVNDFCHQNNYKFLFELLVEPVLQAEIMKKSIAQLQESGIEPDVWKLECLEKIDEMTVVVEQAQSGGRGMVKVVISDRGESGVGKQAQLAALAVIPGVVGFAVGRAIFKQALLDFHAKKIDRAQAVEIIARNYKNFVDFFKKIKNNQ